MVDYSDFRKSDSVEDRRKESHHRPIQPHYQGMGRMLLEPQDHSRLAKMLGSTTLDNTIMEKPKVAKESEDKDSKQTQKSGDMPTMSPGVMKWMMEFLKSNPDLAREMSTRMNAVINGKTIDAQNGNGPPPGPGMQMPGMGGQQPPMQMAGDVLPMKGEQSMGPGPTSTAAGYAVGKQTDPKVQTIGMPTLQGWAQRQQGK